MRFVGTKMGRFDVYNNKDTVIVLDVSECKISQL